MRSAPVRFEDVGKRYEDQWVVRHIDLPIRAGEFFTFLGPSGCGKTTLLRILAGFVVPEEGLVYIDDEPVNDVPAWRRDVGMVFQNYALWPHLTVFENIAFGLRERKLARSEIEARVGKALELVELSGAEGRRPSQLSGGQQQRVALARTLVIEPRVLLLDEPLSNLDAKHRVEMRLELLKLQARLGLTTIYVTHDQEEALAMSTRVAVIHQGRIAQAGTPREIYEEPADDFVAAFVGQSNLLPASIVAIGERDLTVGLAGGPSVQIPLLGPCTCSRPGEPVLLGIRPEALRVLDHGASADASHRIEGTVIASAYGGGSVEYEIATLGKIIKARMANPKGKPLFRSGDRVVVAFTASDLTVIPSRAASDGGQ